MDGPSLFSAAAPSSAQGSCGRWAEDQGDNTLRKRLACADWLDAGTRLPPMGGDMGKRASRGGVFGGSKLAGKGGGWPLFRNSRDSATPAAQPPDAAAHHPWPGQALVYYVANHPPRGTRHAARPGVAHIYYAANLQNATHSTFNPPLPSHHFASDSLGTRP